MVEVELLQRKRRWIALCEEQSGVLTIDATLSLCMVMMVVMFIINMGQIYQAQNVIYHTMLQETKAMSVYSYKDQLSVTETETLVNNILELFNGKEENTGVAFKTAWNDKDIKHAAELLFPEYLAGAGDDCGTKADEILKQYGLENGMDDLDFSGSKINDDGDIEIHAKYKVQLIWPLFGIEELELKQSTLARKWE